ncbi:hypothetical protein ALC57_17842, partial [Trachymyrmex cornetzi]
NTNLKNWSPSSLRRAGVCEDHFTPESFANITTKKLKRDALPIPYDRRKKKKQELQKLIREQNLHPVAEAMINLQLHTPKAEYTEEEKNLSRQLYYYSASAFCRLRKAGCNFPAQLLGHGWKNTI